MSYYVLTFNNVYVKIEMQNPDSNIIAIGEPYCAPSLQELIAAELTRIETLQHEYADQQQLTTILNQLKAINGDQLVNLQTLQSPMPLPSRKNQKSNKKRAPIALEIHEEKSKKKEKT